MLNLTFFLIVLSVLDLYIYIYICLTFNIFVLLFSNDWSRFRKSDRIYYISAFYVQTFARTLFQTDNFIIHFLNFNFLSVEELDFFCSMSFYNLWIDFYKDMGPVPSKDMQTGSRRFFRRQILRHNFSDGKFSDKQKFSETTFSDNQFSNRHIFRQSKLF